MKRKRIISAEATLSGFTTVRVRFSEVDSMKVVWHGEYVRYFEDGREAFGKQYPGINYLDIYNSGFSAPIVDIHIEYLKPLMIDDVVLVETKYISTQGAKMCFEYIIRRADNENVVARGTTIQVFLDVNGDLCLNPPPFYEEWKKRWNI